jgi:hypothetical protein
MIYPPPGTIATAGRIALIEIKQMRLIVPAPVLGEGAFGAARLADSSIPIKPHRIVAEQFDDDAGKPC